MKRLSLVLAMLLAGCGGSDVTDVSSGTVIRNVTIVNTRDGSQAPRMAVVVDGGRIVKIAATEYIRTTGSATDVDASGKYLVPGYLDMHTHAIDAAGQSPSFWPLLIANGITGVREMRGSAALVAQAKQINADRASGVLDAPEILAMPGEIFGGELLGFTPLAGSTSASAAVTEVQKQKGYGASFIKSVRATRDANLALLAEAKNQGLTVVGHLSPTLGALESSNAGWHAIEHFGGNPFMLLDCSSQEDTLRAQLLAGAPLPALRQPLIDSYDDSKCQSLAKTFVKNDTWNVPTLIRIRTGLLSNAPEYLNDPNLAYVPKATRAAWAGAAAAYAKTYDATAQAALAATYAKLKTFPALLKANGAPLLAGSDTASLAVWVIPGFSLHQEFALLAEAGLTPLDILQATTLNGAKFLGREATMGTVDEGRNADLVLLDADPIASATNLDRIAGVFLRGKYFSAAALAKLKSDVAAAYAAQPAPSEAERRAAMAAMEAHTD
ncbi:amidohydrolase family protein [Pelomonas sp. KK5]|uniref:amidohydrolase family protein n=1 Tax=Pelomonas sp. KK5 TaxID=1855730 RepID=UPI00097BCED7|nr:amidohydrolase family protein [Pelomonas sp. KK5]